MWKILNKRVQAWILIYATFWAHAMAVDRSKFMTCAQTDFCQRHRTQKTVASVVSSSLQITENVIYGDIHVPESNSLLKMTLYITVAGALRLQVFEKDIEERYAPSHILLEESLVPAPLHIKQLSEHQHLIKSSGAEEQYVLDLAKFVIYGYMSQSDREKGQTFIIFNENGGFYFEVHESASQHNAIDEHGSRDEAKKVKEEEEERKIIDWGEDGKPIYEDGESYEETGDSVEESSDSDLIAAKSASIGIDVTFTGSDGVFGIPEHATTFNLKDTIKPQTPEVLRHHEEQQRDGVLHYEEPFRLYNLDVFEYELDEPMALYGHIPVLHSLSSQGTRTLHGMLWNNPSETYVDIETLIGSDGIVSKRSRWMSEAGRFDLFIFGGDVFTKQRRLLGPQMLPPVFALGYHQCRWNYVSQDDLLEVNENFEKYDIPLDVLWLDIEHTDGKRYFTFDKVKFKEPKKMMETIDFYGRKVVTIVDPHVKRDKKYFIHKECQANGYYIKNSDGKEFDGWCWPGSSSYPDFTDANVRDFWSSQFDTEIYKGSVNGVTYIWNDMNEPSVFNHKEVTIPRDSINIAGAEFREFHNAYGLYFQASSDAGLLHRDLKSKGLDTVAKWRNLDFVDEGIPEMSGLQRGFVLSRAFYSGTQRFGAIWTGDNAAEWTHLRVSVPMLLSMSVTGLQFVGADVGGFFGNPSEELLIRWYQTGSLQPFFRAHAHIDTKRREPYVFGEETRELISKSIYLRYTLLPFIYTAFYEAFTNGFPVMRPLFLHFGKDYVNVEDQWMLGESIMVAPVLWEGAKERKVVFPGEAWYAIETGEKFEAGIKTFAVDIESTFVFQRSGSIISRKLRKRRSSKAMKDDEISLFVALDSRGKANGMLYLDDESTFDFIDKKSRCEISFAVAGGRLTSSVSCTGGFKPKNQLLQIVFYGKKLAKASMVESESSISGDGDCSDSNEITISESESFSVVRHPGVSISDSFSLALEWN